MLENNISDMNSNNNIQDTPSTASEQDEVNKFINSTSKCVNLPKKETVSLTPTTSLKTNKEKVGNENLYGSDYPPGYTPDPHQTDRGEACSL